MKSTLYLKFALLYIVFGFLSLFTTSILGQQLLLNQLENNASQSLYKEANVIGNHLSSLLFFQQYDVLVGSFPSSPP